MSSRTDPGSDVFVSSFTLRKVQRKHRSHVDISLLWKGVLGESDGSLLKTTQKTISSHCWEFWAFNLLRVICSSDHHPCLDCSWNFVCGLWLYGHPLARQSSPQYCFSKHCSESEREDELRKTQVISPLQSKWKSWKRTWLSGVESEQNLQVVQLMMTAVRRLRTKCEAYQANLMTMLFDQQAAL